MYKINQIFIFNIYFLFFVILINNSQQFDEEINEKSLRHLSNRRFKRDFMLAVGNSSNPLPTCFRVIFEII